MSKSGFLSNLFTKVFNPTTDEDDDDLIDAAAPTGEKSSKKDGKKKGLTPPVRPEIYYGYNFYLKPAGEELADEGCTLWLPGEFREKLKKEMGEDPTADPDDVIKSRVASGTMEWIFLYVDDDGKPVRTATPPDEMRESALRDFACQNANADAAYAAAKDEYRKKKLGATEEKPATKEFKLTDEILDLVSGMDAESRRDFLASAERDYAVSVLDRAKILAARPKPDSTVAPAPAPASPDAPTPAPAPADSASTDPADHDVPTGSDVPADSEGDDSPMS